MVGISWNEVQSLRAFQKKYSRATAMQWFSPHLIWVKSGTNIFLDECFVVTPYPYSFICNARTVSKRPPLGFQRNTTQYAMIARAPGTHPQQCTTSFDSNSKQYNCSFSCYAIEREVD